MSEKLLKTIIKILAIVAMEDDIADGEAKAMYNFLVEHVGRKSADRYLRFFHDYVKHLQEKQPTVEQRKKIVINLAKELNAAFIQKQKVLIMVDLLELIIADGDISDIELKWLYLIGGELRVSRLIIDHLGSFAVNKTEEELEADGILIANSENSPDSTQHLYVEGLSGMLVFCQIPKSNTYFAKYLGQSTMNLNGVPMRDNRIWPFPLGCNIKGQGISPIYYSDVVGRFQAKEDLIKISFVAENISYQFKNGNIGLREVNFSEPTGKLIGIMGGSGAGKSTLFNVLNGNEIPNTGSVRINGIDIHQNKEKLEGVIGYVPQDDLLLEDLTVFDNLYYATKLCFADLDEKSTIKLVNSTLLALGLLETRHLKVGNVLDKTISGGQRKRLNIGLELLREPNVLFVDEPTSGLSSRDSENIMDLLKELSLKGKMVFAVIHQPSSEIFKMFDKLLLLDVGGYQIYYGNPVEAINYFKKMVDLLDKNRGECSTCGNVNPELIFDIIESRQVDEYGQLTHDRKISPEEWYEHFKKEQIQTSITEETENPPKNLFIPSKWKQLNIFITRDVLSKLSNSQYLIINLFEAPILALLLAIVVRYSGADGVYTFRENANIPAFFFMSVIVSVFMGLTISAEEIIRDRKILKREAFLNLSHLSYLSSKTIILFSISAIQMFLFVLIGDAILEIKDMGMAYFAILFSIACFANMLGLNISSTFNSAVTIYILIPLLVIPQLILSGVVVNFDKLNPSFTSEEKVPLVGEMMASRWAYEAIVVTQFKNNTFEKEYYEYDRTIALGEYKTIYYIPYLESYMDYCHLNMDSKDKDVRRKMTERLNLVRNEIKKELTFIGKDQFPQIESLTLSSFDSRLYLATTDFLKALRKYYNNIRNEATSEKDKKIAAISQSPQEKEKFIKMRNSFQNEALIHLLKNTTSDIRIIEQNGELIQKVYPIYAKNEFPSSDFDFRTNFYYPEKYFFGWYISTPIFNIMVIWFFTIVLFITLYFDVFRKIIYFKDYL